MTADAKLADALGEKAPAVLRALHDWVDRVIELQGTHSHESAEPRLSARMHLGQFQEARLERDERYS